MDSQGKIKKWCQRCGENCARKNKLCPTCGSDTMVEYNTNDNGEGSVIYGLRRKRFVDELIERSRRFGQQDNVSASAGVSASVGESASAGISASADVSASAGVSANAGVSSLVLQNETYLINAHGSNTGQFFELPPNTRVFLPLIGSTPLSPLGEILITEMALTKVDPICSNIEKTLDEYLAAMTTRHGSKYDFKVYDSRFTKECPIVFISPEKDSFNSGISHCPVKIGIEFLKDTDDAGNPVLKGSKILLDEVYGEKAVLSEVKRFKKEIASSMSTSVAALRNPRNYLLAALTPKAVISSGKTPTQRCYFDSQRFQKIEHILTEGKVVYNPKLDKMRQQLHISYGRSPIFLPEFISYCRKQYPDNVTLTFIMATCNSLPLEFDQEQIDNYTRKDKGISYKEFIRKMAEVFSPVSSPNVESPRLGFPSQAVSVEIPPAIINIFNEFLKNGTFNKPDYEKLPKEIQSNILEIIKEYGRSMNPEMTQNKQERFLNFVFDVKYLKYKTKYLQLKNNLLL